ncbi:2-amino-1-hydroxyethylphosphonate dioxygenase (glycine-forming)-like isoform X1 [Patiria miniata]|uniref:HD domain-containing protein n=1 Tax=Patiria miniata TaxID=46514 RepID=A0A914B6M7_PATMI|nr:2-amino-1-hydroxyethylphosphonate dioxygenase (glycine-forming)-like isoform X1 [Patiria miniata]
MSRCSSNSCVMDVAVDETIQAIFSLFERYGSSDYQGEHVTQTEHMVQCAMLAEQEGGPVPVGGGAAQLNHTHTERSSPAVVLGALFHDIGHLVGRQQEARRMETDGVNLGVTGHEIIGQEFLENLGIPRSVSVFSKGHVDAKRYLVYKEKGYYDRLSDASKKTLVHQGGPMTAQEAELFEAEPQLAAILKMRQWDEQAKDPTVQIEPLQRYREMCRQFLLTNAA